MAGRSSGKPLADFRKDIANPVFHEAEDRVYRWLLAHGHTVEDRRDSHTFYDFKVDDNRTLDVKCDTRARDTGNISWEYEVLHHNGRVQPGWGTHEGLHLVAFLLAPTQRHSASGRWPLLLVSTRKARDFVAAHQDTAACRRHMTPGTDRDGYCYIVSIAALRAYGAVIQESEA